LRQAFSPFPSSRATIAPPDGEVKRPGKLYCRTDKREQAQERLITATMMYHELDMRFWLDQAEALMNECSGIANPRPAD
jgi:hypothetical protein